MNNPFLHTIADELLHNYTSLENLVLVLPNKRPEVFLKQLIQEKGYNGFLPQFYSIEEFAQEIVGKTVLKGIPLWLKAYEVYQKIDPNETLENALKWFPTTLKDFNEIDIYVEQPNELFQYMIARERIDKWEVEDYSASSLLQNNKLFWEKLEPFYKALQAHLKQESFVTSGMMFREAAESAKDYIISHENTHFVFAGFNALSRVEQILFETFQEKAKVQFLWDVDSYYFDSEIQEAGSFLRKYAKKYPEWKIQNQVKNEFRKEKNIQSYGASKQVIQAKFVNHYLQSLPPEELQNTALVLCDENALNSVIESIPPEIDKVNITMGYPLQKNEIFLFFENIFKGQRNLQLGGKWNTRDVLNLLNSYQTSTPVEEKLILNAKKNWTQEKKIRLSESDLASLGNTKIYPLLLPISNSTIFISNCRDFCLNAAENERDNVIQKSVFQKLALVFEELGSYVQSEEITIEILPTLFKQLIQNTSIDFVGEPLKGLQIMGLLETRLLNFKNIVLLNVNEGVIPLGRTENSFIPFDVKRKYKIDTFLENDSVYAYHFYRFLQSAPVINLVYNQVSESLQTGEKSRFIAQIEWESPHEIKHSSLKISGEVPSYDEVEVVHKSEAIVEKLETWLKGKISPSSLNSYLYNPIDFFQRYVLKIREKDVYEDQTSPLLMGQLVHRCLELMYQEFVIQEVDSYQKITQKALESKLEKVESYLEESIQSLGYPLYWFERGNNLIELKIAERMIVNLLQSDIKDLRENHTLEILSLEQYYTTEINHPELGALTFGGYIDRVDKRDGVLRVIDYKTGGIKRLNTHKKEEVIPLDEKSTQIVQLSLYAEMAFSNFQTQEVLCGIYGLKKLKDGVHYLNENGSEIITPESNAEIVNQIVALISEIISPNIDFEYEPKETYF